MPSPILIAVPPHLVPAVTKIIANDGAGDAHEPENGSLLHGWTEETLREHYRDSSENMREFLVYLAEHADEEVTSDAAAEAVGLRDWNSIAGMLGAAQRRAGNHFGREYGPWRRRWATDGHARLKMPGNVAAIVLSEAAAQGDR